MKFVQTFNEPYQGRISRKVVHVQKKLFIYFSMLDTMACLVLPNYFGRHTNVERTS